MGDIWVNAVTAVVAAAIGWAGAWVQSRSGHAQARAASHGSAAQVHAAELQFLRSSRGNACSVVVAEVLEFEKRLTAFSDGKGPGAKTATTTAWAVTEHDGTRTVAGHPRSPARRARRQREQYYLELVASLGRLRLACAVLNLHGPDEVDAAAVELLAACEETVNGVHGRFLEFFFSWSRDWAVREVARIREARRQFARVAGPHLNSA